MSDSENDRLRGDVKNDSGRAERLVAEFRRNLQRRKQRSKAVAARDRAANEADAAAATKEPPEQR